MMPGETQSRTAGTAGSCQNCSTLQQSLNEYVAALLALKQKIIDTDHLLTEYQQKCDELQITERENSTLRHQLEEMLQKISPQEKCQEELESLKAELEEKKSSLKVYRQTHLEYIRVKEEYDKSVAVKKKLEAKVKKLEDTAEKQNQDFKQLKMEKKVLEKELKKTQEKLEGFQKESHKKALKHAHTQVASEEPVINVDKRKIKQLLEELWGCIDSATEGKRNKDDNHFLVSIHSHSRTPETKQIKFISEDKVSKKQSKPRKSDACIVAPSHNSLLELCEVQSSATALQRKKNSEPQGGDPIMRSKNFEGDAEDCNGDNVFYEAMTMDMLVKRDSPNNSSDSDQEDDHLDDKLLEVLKWAKPLPPLLSPQPLSPSVTQLQNAMFGELTDSSDEEANQNTHNVEYLPENNISESWSNCTSQTISERTDSGEQPCEPVNGENRSSKLEGNERLVTSDILAVMTQHIQERESKTEQTSETAVSPEYISANAEHVAEPMDFEVKGTLNDTQAPELSHITETKNKSMQSETTLAAEEVITNSGYLIQTLNESVQSKKTDFTQRSGETNLDESVKSNKTVFATDSMSTNPKHFQKTCNELIETDGEYILNKLEGPKSDHTEERDRERIQTEQSILLPEFELRNYKHLDLISCESVAAENVQAKLDEHNLSPKAQRNGEPLSTEVKNISTLLGTLNQEYHSETISESQKTEGMDTKLACSSDSAVISEGDRILCCHQYERMQASETDIIKNVPKELYHSEEKVQENLQTEQGHISSKLEITNTETNKKTTGESNVSEIKFEPSVPVIGNKTDLRQVDETTDSTHTCTTAKQVHDKTAEMAKSNNSLESTYYRVTETNNISKNDTDITNTCNVVHTQHALKFKELLKAQEQGSLPSKPKHDPDKGKKPLQTDIIVHMLPQKDVREKSDTTVIQHYVSADQVLATERVSEVTRSQKNDLWNHKLLSSAIKSGIEPLSDVADEHLISHSKFLIEKNNERLKTEEVIVERISSVESEQDISHAQSFLSDAGVSIETESSQIDRINVELNEVQSNKKLTHSSNADKNPDIVVIGLGQEKNSMDHPAQAHDFAAENKLVFSEISGNKKQFILSSVFGNEAGNMCKEEIQSNTVAFNSEGAHIATDISLHSIPSLNAETLKSNCKGVDYHHSRKDEIHLLRHLKEGTEKGHDSEINRLKQLNSSPGCKDNELETENGPRQLTIAQEPQKSLRNHVIPGADLVCCGAKDHPIKMHIDHVTVKEGLVQGQNTAALSVSSVGSGLLCTNPLERNQMKEDTLAKSVLECTERVNINIKDNNLNIAGVSGKKQLCSDMACEKSMEIPKETECDDLEEDNYPLRKVKYTNHLKKCSLVTEERERTSINIKKSEFLTNLNLTINDVEISSTLNTNDNMAAAVQNLVTLSSESPSFIVNESPSVMEMCDPKEIGIQCELLGKPLLGKPDIVTLHTTMEHFQKEEEKELSNATKHTFDGINVILPSVELSVPLAEASATRNTNLVVSEVNASQHQVLEHSRMKIECLVNSKSNDSITSIEDMGVEKLKSNMEQVVENQTVAKGTSPQNAACEELNDKQKQTSHISSTNLCLQAKPDFLLSCDNSHTDTQKDFQMDEKTRHFDKSYLWNLSRTDEIHDPRANTISNISTKIQIEANKGKPSGKVPQGKGKVNTFHGQGNQPVLANADTSSARNHSPDTITKVRSEMGPPLPPLLPPLMATPPRLLPPLIATPPRALHPVSPIMSTSSRSSLPSPLDDLISPLRETPVPPFVSPLSDDPRYKSPVLKTPSPSDVLSRRVLSSPLQFCAATPKHALPVPGRLPPSAAGNPVPGKPQDSIRILDTMYPELSARARTLNILKGNIQLNRCVSVDCKNLPGPVNQITGFKAITSTSTAFMKTGNSSNNDRNKDRPRDLERVPPPSNSLGHNGKRSLMPASMPKSAKRLCLDRESPCTELIKKDRLNSSTEEFDARSESETSNTACNGSRHHKQADKSSSVLPSLVQESGDLNKEAINNALKKIGESCFDLLPVIRSHVKVGNISKAPVMRDEEKEVVYEFTDSKKILAELLLCSIINKLKTEMRSLDHCYLQALCRVYVGVCRQLGDLERARLFCYNILKEGFPESEKLTLFIVSVWHDIFSLQGVINKAMQALIRQRAKGEVLNCLSSYLNWEKSPPLNIGIILSSLLMAIELCPNVKFQLSEQFGEDLSDTMWEYLFAIDLLCCHRKWIWTHDNVISKELWPIMDKWVKHRKGHVNIASTPNIIVAAVLRLIGRLGQIGLREGFVSAVKNISSVISAFIQHANEEDMPWGVQLASVYTLYDLAPSDPVGILKTLQGWRTGTSNSIPPAVTNCIAGINSLCVLNS